MTNSNNKSSLVRTPIFISLFLSLIIYISLFAIFNYIELKRETIPLINEVYLEFEDKYDIAQSKKENGKLEYPGKINSNYVKKKTALSVINREEQIEVYSDSAEINTLYSQSMERKDSLISIDSFIVENPSLISLQIALKDHLNKNGFYRSKNAELILTIEKSMQDYYKMKYPTPVHKFGEQGSGAGITIPIDNIIELFE
jgi:hypothetical protein